MSEQWSWDQNPINLTCIATAIPNATITWWYRDREINREIIDRNYRVFGHGPRSDLIVTPLDLQYYGRYTCKAINPHGEAFYEIGLSFFKKKLILRGEIIKRIFNILCSSIPNRFERGTRTWNNSTSSY